ncbi:MAG: ABC transporter permease, partial [Cyclobacteriaceae bacterium]|nr:ABC transporter permease [Cyclobacteriaceae bacterium]
ILVTLIAFSLSFTLVQMSIPGFNQLAMVNISLIDFNTPFIWLLIILGILFLGIISGLYPAFYLTSIRSVSLIKGAKLSGSTGSLFRKALLTFQFSMSILLVIGLVTNLKQLNYAKNMDLGFNMEQIIKIWTPTLSSDKYSLRETIKERLLQNPNISKVSFSWHRIGGKMPADIVLEIDGSKRYIGGIGADPDYLDLFGIEIVDGRGFSWERKGDKYPSEKFGAIFNETAAKQFWDESPVGKIYKNVNSIIENLQFEIIGVARDFHYSSLHHKIQPTCIFWIDAGGMNIKISPFEIPSTIEHIKKEWEDIFGSYTKRAFSYSFLDEAFDRQYKNDEQTAKIIAYFTVLAIIIACMGLFALSSFMVVRRTKEIGIRKAMGASVENIFLLLSKEFIK